MKIRYNSKLKDLSRELRKSGNLAEVLLWNQLKGSKLRGLQFMRQKPIGNFIVDFYCSSLKLVIEIDGRSHDQKPEEDRLRQEWLESLGLSVLRFQDSSIRDNIEGVVQAIEQFVDVIGKDQSVI